MADGQAKAGEDPVKVSVVRKVVLSYWTVAVLSLAAFVGHVRWYARGGPASEVISGFGATLVVLGIFVAARPFLRAGVRPMAEQSVAALAPHTFGYGGPPPEAYAAHEGRIKAAIPDVWAERVIAVLVIVLGTLLNGYGPVIARGLHHLYLLHAKSMGHG